MINSFSEFLHTILESGLEAIGLYYGVYRAKVIDNADPDNLGKLKIQCEQVHGGTYPDVWSWPETPYAGNGFGMWAIPDIGESVYVRFDHGRPEKPIWHGGWWGTGETTDDMTLKKVVLTTLEGLKIVIDRDAASILLEQALGNSVLIDPNQIYLQHSGSIICEGQDVTVQSMGTTELRAQGVVLLEALDEVRITSTGLVKIDAADDLDISCSAMVTLYAAMPITLQSDKEISLTSPTAINLAAPSINMTGDLNLAGNGKVTGSFYAAKNSAMHTHPVTTGGTAEEGTI